MDDCQRAFEKFMRETYTWKDPVRKCKVTGNYTHEKTRNMWIAFQAAWEARGCAVGLQAGREE